MRFPDERRSKVREWLTLLMDNWFCALIPAMLFKILNDPMKGFLRELGFLSEVRFQRYPSRHLELKCVTEWHQAMCV
jgi:hypothetical protein